MRNVAVILAGGVGRRAGMPVPKQFAPLGDRMVIEYPIETFEAHPQIDEVALVLHPDWTERMAEVAAQRGWKKVRRFLRGGAERYLSSLAAVEAYKGEEGVNLLLHDAARPFVAAETIGRVCDALVEHEAVAVALPSTDTVFRLSPRGTVSEVPTRGSMYLAQTPQAFRLRLLEDAFRKAMADGAVSATDDCGLVLKYRPDVEIYVVEGTAENMKLTFFRDIEQIKKILDGR